MLIVDVHTLQAVDFLDLRNEVVLQRLGPENAKNIVRIERPVHQRFARLDVIAVLDVDMRTAWDIVFAFRTVLAGDDDLSLTF